VGETRYLEAARRTLSLFRPQLAQPGCASLLAALADALEPPTIVLLRGPEDGVREWQHRLARRWNGFCLALPNGLILPAALSKPESAEVNAWVCSGVTCLAPVGDFNKLSRIILIPD